MEGDHLSALALDPPTGPWTVDDFFALPETHTKVELQDGSYVVSPSSTSRHQFVTTGLIRALHAQLPSDVAMIPEVDVVLSRTSVRRPDLSIGLRERLLRRSYPEGSDLTIAVEIVSPSSGGTDRLLKPVEYAAAGIAGYWRIEIDPDITLTAYRLDAGEYAEIGTWGPGETAHLTSPIDVTIPINELSWT